eukprot:SAG31_NODE_9284_length_1304_cov_1.387552_2_plen_225_part_01
MCCRPTVIHRQATYDLLWPFVCRWGDVNREMGAVDDGGLGTISDESQWIWSDEPDAHNDVYCRLEIPVTCDTDGPAPTPPPPPLVMPTCTSFSSCDDLADAFGGTWGNPASGGSDQVCGESDHGFDTGSTLCFGGNIDGGLDTATDGWFHAQTICFGMGARLCTSEELLADETRGSGCQHDLEMTWTSVECTDGHIIAVGASNQAQGRVDDGSCTDVANCIACAA